MASEITIAKWKKIGFNFLLVILGGLVLTYLIASFMFAIPERNALLHKQREQENAAWLSQEKTWLKQEIGEHIYYVKGADGTCEALYVQSDVELRKRSIISMGAVQCATVLEGKIIYFTQYLREEQLKRDLDPFLSPATSPLQPLHNGDDGLP